MSDLAAMTVNERLSATGLLFAWDEALKRGDREAMIKLLGKVELANQAAGIVESTLRRINRSSAS